MQPKSSDDAISAMRDAASPVGAFVRERCELTGEIAVDDLFSAWQSWADSNGYKAGGSATFGKDLRAAAPMVRRSRTRDEDSRVWLYVGIRLQSSKSQDADVLGPAMTNHDPYGPGPSSDGYPVQGGHSSSDEDEDTNSQVSEGHGHRWS